MAMGGLALSSAVLALSACATLGTPGFGGAEAAGAASAVPALPAEAVVGESGIAAGIPAAVEVFAAVGVQADTQAEAAPSADGARVRTLPTLLPRGLPEADAIGEDFADRVSISPDGRRLIVGTQQGDRFEVQIVGVNRKDVERREVLRGRTSFVGWAGPREALIGYERGNDAVIEAWDIASGKRRTLAKGRGVGGVLSVGEDGRVATARPGRDAFVCADGAAPTAYEGQPIVQAGPRDAQGRIVYRTTNGANGANGADGADAKGALVPYDCEAGAFAEPIYEGAAFDGALADTAGGGYLAVWDGDGVRYLDPSLAYEMREVERSFPSEVEVWPIEFTRSPNTLLLYVSGEGVAPSYYVLDRYAGALDLHVSYAAPE